jgi:hypothetical protein
LIRIDLSSVKKKNRAKISPWTVVGFLMRGPLRMSGAFRDFFSWDTASRLPYTMYWCWWTVHQEKTQPLKFRVCPTPHGFWVSSNLAGLTLPGKSAAPLAAGGSHSGHRRTPNLNSQSCRLLPSDMDTFD